MNIYEIAEKADVSITTVSRVLNNSEKVKPETRKRILQIIKDYNYKPKIIRNKVPNIVILINDKRVYFSEYFSNILNGITEAINNLNFQQTIAKVDNNFREEDILFLLRERKADAALIFLSNKESLYLHLLKEEEVPFLLINNNYFNEYNFIETDNFDGMCKLLEYLYKNGHRKIAYITHSLKFPDHFERFKAYKNFYKNHNIDLDEQLIINMDDFDPMGRYLPYDEGYLSAKKLFSSNKDFTAIACSNDELAFGVMHYCRENSIDVPNQISVTGYDNYEITRFIDPKLTTINQKLLEMGKSAVNNLIKIMNNPNKKVQITFKSELVIGNSVSKIS